jgi:hypothetical protein
VRNEFSGAKKKILINCRSKWQSDWKLGWWSIVSLEICGANLICRVRGRRQGGGDLAWVDYLVFFEVEDGWLISLGDFLMVVNLENVASSLVAF